MREEELHRWLCTRTGLELSRGGGGSVLRQFVERRTVELGCGLEDYLARVSDDGAEFELLANEVTVVYTWFFRDPSQLAGVEEVLAGWDRPRPARIWVPGCATGEDVYSVALIAERLGVEARILGTDLNTRALAAARRGEYSERELRDLGPEVRVHFAPRPGGRFGLSEAIRRRVSFLRHNLVDPVPGLDGAAGWDLILCRNVFIYFEARRALDVFQQLARSLTPGGYLLLGASEIVYEVPNGLRAVRLAQRLALQRCDSGAPVARPTVAASPRRSSPPPPRAASRLLAPSLPPGPSEGTPQRRSVLAAAGAESTPVDSPLERGHALLAQSRLADALQCYETAVQREPTNADAFMHRGIAHYLRGEVELAAKDLRAASFLNDKLWLGAFYLALSYESMGRVNEALREYRRLIALVDAEPTIARAPGPAPWAGWCEDIVQLARHRLARAQAPLPQGPRT